MSNDYWERSLAGGQKDEKDLPTEVIIGRRIDDLIDLISANPEEAKKVDLRTWRTLFIYVKDALVRTNDD